MNRRTFRRLRSNAMVALMMAAVIVAVLPLLLILGSVILKGAGSLSVAFFTRVPVPAELFEASWREDGWLPGGTVHPPNLALKKWLCEQVSGPPLDWSVSLH